MYRSAVLLFALTFVPSLAAAQAPCTTDANRVVNEIYRHMLERAPDAGSSHWVQELQNRRTVQDVVREIAKSPEHTERFWKQENGEETPYYRAVGTIYRHILSRQPDATGARAWAELGARSGPAAVVDQILNSNEYNTQFGDWGVPGSGGIRFCGTNNQGASGTLAPQTAPQAAGRANANANMRFGGMDANNDGQISRSEWNGSRQSFNTHDWNNDGVLSGDEVRTGSARRGRTEEDMEFDRDDRFEFLDANGNGRVEPREWHGTVAAFNRLDVNNDNTLSRAEVVGESQVGVAPTTGEFFFVDSTRPWTDTGITVRAGQTVLLQVDGTVRLSETQNDVADAGGSRNTRRRALDAPLPRSPAGGLIMRIGNSEPVFVGNRQSFRAPSSGRIFLGVNDDFHEDNDGEFRVTLDVR